MKRILSFVLLGSFALFPANGEIEQSTEASSIQATGHRCPNEEYYCYTFKMCVPNSWDCSW